MHRLVLRVLEKRVFRILTFNALFAVCPFAVHSFRLLSIFPNITNFCDFSSQRCVSVSFVCQVSIWLSDNNMLCTCQLLSFSSMCKCCNLQHHFLILYWAKLILMMLMTSQRRLTCQRVTLSNRKLGATRRKLFLPDSTLLRFVF